MASVLSHPAVPLALAPALGPVRAAVAAGALLSILPDADAIGFWTGVPYGAPLGHRGLTHSFAFAAVLALFAFCAGAADLPREPRSRRAFCSSTFFCAPPRTACSTG